MLSAMCFNSSLSRFIICLVRQGLFFMYHYFYKWSIPYTGFPDKCHIRVFSALIFWGLMMHIMTEMTMIYSRLTADYWFNPFPNDKFYTLPNWKCLQTTISNIWKWKKVLQMDRKHCGKRRNCSLRAISPFPSVFSKDFYCKPFLVWERVNKAYVRQQPVAW